MADILTQLQTCLDQLATQFYATLCYLTTYHDHSPAQPPPNIPTAIPKLNKIPKNPPPAPAAATTTTTTTTTDPNPTGSPPEPTEPPPDPPHTFAQRQRELARDLIIKEQQIEYLISVLPGVGSSEKEQEERIRRVAGELRVVEGERRRRRREMRRLGERVEGVLAGVEGARMGRVG
ncbi:RNA polymerase II mediator complex subunit [Emmonsiellopsis sp. PD_33]|nr:RNA polymerase II mediator complex subunit [Emmonsiellopsis sp. PD_33]